MPDHKVTIRVHPDGNIDYLPGLLNSRRLETIQWRCQEGPFTVSFHDETPFKKLDLHSMSQSGPFFETDAVPVREDAAFATYHYSVAVAVIEDIEQRLVKVILGAGCPEVRVDF